MIGQNKKRLEITLANDEYALLESLSSRFNISKSSVIKQALKVFASKRKHGWTTWIQEATKPMQSKDNYDEYKDIDIKDLVDDPTPVDKKDDGLPF